MRNVMTIDLEEFFHAENLSEAYPRQRWEHAPRRANALVHQILGALRDADVRATFFVLGWLAEREPGLVRDLAAEGHEVGCHGYGHDLIYHMSPQEFGDDLRRATDVIAGIVGQPPRSFRAPTFSITERSLWALEILKAQGYAIDSSIYPVRRRRYGMPGTPTGPYVHGSGLKEFPLSVVPIGRRQVPVSGGGFFRLWPLSFSVWAIRRINAAGRPYLFYMHPWETDTSEPRPPGLKPATAFQHYFNRRRTLARFKCLLHTFEWSPLRDSEAWNGKQP
jgi:polysaccharide deacetylase family protein (PEP-CTERM system associated)